MITTLLMFMLVVAIVGFCAWAIAENVSMPPVFKALIYLIAVVIVILFVVQYVLPKAGLH